MTGYGLEVAIGLPDRCALAAITMVTDDYATLIEQLAEQPGAIRDDDVVQWEAEGGVIVSLVWQPAEN